MKIHNIRMNKCKIQEKWKSLPPRLCLVGELQKRITEKVDNNVQSSSQHIAIYVNLTSDKNRGKNKPSRDKD